MCILTRCAYWAGAQWQFSLLKPDTIKIRIWRVKGSEKFSVHKSKIHKIRYSRCLLYCIERSSWLMERPKALTQMGLGAWNLKKHTDKKEKKIFLIYREIQSGAVLKSYMRKGKYAANISSYMRRPLLIYDFATAPLWISLYMRKIWFSFYQCIV